MWGICHLIRSKDRYLLSPTTALEIIENTAHFTLFQFSFGFAWLYDITLRPFNLPAKQLSCLFLELRQHYFTILRIRLSQSAGY